MPTVSKSAKLYQEQFSDKFTGANAETTRRSPGPRVGYDLNQVHHLTLRPPAPPAEVLQTEDDRPPDAAATDAWPYGRGEVNVT